MDGANKQVTANLTVNIIEGIGKLGGGGTHLHPWLEDTYLNLWEVALIC